MEERLHRNNTRKDARESGSFDRKKSLLYIIVGDILRSIVETYNPQKYFYFCPKSQHLQNTIDRSPWVLLGDERSMQTHTWTCYSGNFGNSKFHKRKAYVIVTCRGAFSRGFGRKRVLEESVYSEERLYQVVKLQLYGVVEDDRRQKRQVQGLSTICKNVRFSKYCYWNRTSRYIIL